MTGNELVKELRGIKGKVYANIMTRDDGFYAPIEKAALMDWLQGCGDSETGMRMKKLWGAWYFETDFDL